MDKVGPICRDVEDCAIVFEAIRGADGLDASVVDSPFNYDPGRDLTSLRVGYRLGLPRGATATLTTITGGSPPDFVILPQYPLSSMLIIMFAEAASAFDELTRFNGDDFLLDQSGSGWANTFRNARTIPAVEYLLADRLRGKLIQDMDELMQDVDLFVAPATDDETLFVANYTGHPCVVIPGGSGTGICFIGRLHDEATVLAFAKAFQDATTFHTAHPPLFVP